MSIKNIICPLCGNNSAVTGVQTGYAAMSSTESIWKGSDLYHDICLRCGTVIRSYVKDPAKLIKKRDR